MAPSADQALLESQPLAGGEGGAKGTERPKGKAKKAREASRARSERGAAETDEAQQTSAAASGGTSQSKSTKGKACDENDSFFYDSSESKNVNEKIVGSEGPYDTLENNIK